MHQDQEVPNVSIFGASSTDLGRLGCLFGSSFGPSCYQQQSQPPAQQGSYKTVGPPAGSAFPTDWREAWHQEGNSCGTDESEQYPQDHDFHSQTNTDLKSSPSSTSSPSKQVFSPCYPTGTILPEYSNGCHPHHAPGCFYPPYSRTPPQDTVLQPAVDTDSTAIKQEPADKDADNGVSFDKSKAIQHKSSWTHHSNNIGLEISEQQEHQKQPDPTESKNGHFQSSGRRGSLQLWQFLVALLDAPDASAGCIAWTGRGMEFKLIEPEEVARRWGAQKNRPAMNYDKLSRSLRYYYEKGIMQKVAGERYVYKFVCDPEALFNMAYGAAGHHQTTHSTSDAHHHHHHIGAQRPENLSTKMEKAATHHLAYTADMFSFYGNCHSIAHQAHSYQHLQPYLQEAKHRRYT